LTQSGRSSTNGSDDRRALAAVLSAALITTFFAFPCLPSRTTNEAIMLVHHGFTRRTLADPVRAGFATPERTIGKVDGKAIQAGRIRITAAGRSALED
jgi:hypothetical protein